MSIRRTGSPGVSLFKRLSTRVLHGKTEGGDVTTLGSTQGPARKVWRKRFGALLLAAGLGSGALMATSSLLPAPIAGPVQTVMTSVGSAANTTVGVTETALHKNPHADPKADFGQLYVIRPIGPGQAQVLAQAADVHADGNNVPADAVVNNRIVIGAEAINGVEAKFTAGYTRLLEGQTPDAVNVGQPIVMVHEGVRPRVGEDIKAIIRDMVSLKQIEGGTTTNLKTVYKLDPAVGTLVNVFAQQLHQGHDILVVGDSGGGGETALALNIVAQQPGYHDLIAQHVRVMAFSGAASPQDYQDAGVQASNIFYGAYHADPVGGVGSTYVDPHHPMAGLEQDASILHGTLKNFLRPAARHGYTHVIPDNDINGHQIIQDFIDGGPGGTYIR